MAFKRSGVAVAVLGNTEGEGEGGVRGAYAFGGFSGTAAVKTVEVLKIGVESGIGVWREVW